MIRVIEINARFFKLTGKYLHRISISRQDILNFVGAHPKLTTVLAGIGITLAFGSVGRLTVHEALTSVAASSTPTDLPAVDSTTTTFQVDYVDKTQMSTVPGFQTANAFACFCQECAKEFAPGQEAVSPGDAQNFAPGDLAKTPGDASNFAPGHQLKK
jgi:hypothetical protein